MGGRGSPIERAERRFAQRICSCLKTRAGAAWRTAEALASSLEADVCDVIAALHRLEASGDVFLDLTEGGLKAWRTTATPLAKIKKAGKPSGLVHCSIDLPGIDVKKDHTFYGPRQLSKVRRFVMQWITDKDIAGGSFSVHAVVRHRANQGYRRRLLSKWQAGEPVEAALEMARARWNDLQTPR